MKIYSSEDLTKLSDEELKKICILVRSEINKSKRIKKQNRELEIYFCYILRELEIRGSRVT